LTGLFDPTEKSLFEALTRDKKWANCGLKVRRPLDSRRLVSHLVAGGKRQMSKRRDQEDPPNIRRKAC